MSIAVLVTDGEADEVQSVIIIAATGATSRNTGSQPVYEYHLLRNEDEGTLGLVVRSAITPYIWKLES